MGDAYIVGPADRLLADGTWSYSYDAEGNLVEKSHLITRESWTYRYDHRNQMTLAEKRDANGAVVLRAQYRYDVFGNRIEKAVDWDGDGPQAAEVKRYVLDGWNPGKPIPVGNERFDVYAELDSSNQLVARYLHGDNFDEILAKVTYSEAGLEARPDVLWFLGDHLGSTRLVLDASGAVRNEITYSAFGEIIAQTGGSLDNLVFFAGREYDAETGLYYNRARYYDSHTTARLWSLVNEHRTI